VIPRFAKPDPDVVASAAIVALMDARWESSDLLSRRPSQLTPDLLRGHAAELAASPIGRDQLLSIALDAAAQDLDEGRPALANGALFLIDDPNPAVDARAAVRNAALGQGGVPLAESQRVADDIEQRQRRECIEVRELSRSLAAEARLHELLWDDPRIPADSRTRLVMLCSVPRLLHRAEELDPSRARQRRRQDATGEAFRELESRLKAAARQRDLPLADGSVRTPRPQAAKRQAWSNAAGWFLLAGLFAMVLVSLVGIG
jgi:hypothetical protein